MQLQIDFHEASYETQQVQHSKKRRQVKDIKRCKKCRKVWGKHCQLKVTCGTNVKLLVASLGFVSCVYPKNTKLVTSFLHEKMPWT